jgi:hypothetical protein
MSINTLSKFMGPSIMYKETWDCPLGMLGLELEEVLLLQAKKRSTAVTPEAVNSHVVAVFIFMWFYR